VKPRGHRVRELKRILRTQELRVGQLMRGKLSTLSVAPLLEKSKAR
jgi:hypothetical protein